MGDLVVRVCMVSLCSQFVCPSTSPCQKFGQFATMSTSLNSLRTFISLHVEGSHGKYDGEFVNGLFDGEGTLYMPDGSGRYEGTWEKGKLVDGKFIFKDDLVYEEEKWGYCTNKV